MMPPKAPPASTDTDLRQEVAELRAKLEASEEALRAIHSGDVDAITVRHADGIADLRAERRGSALPDHGRDHERGRHHGNNERRYSVLQSAFRRNDQQRPDTIIGFRLLKFFGDKDKARVKAALGQTRVGIARLQAVLLASDGKQVPVNVTMHGVTDGEAHDVAAVVSDLSEIMAAQAVMTELKLRA